MLVWTICSTSLYPQFPGGISSNLKIWLRSDNGLTTSGANVTQWADNSGAGITGNFGVNQYNSSFPTQTSPTTQQAGVNFNTYVAFNGTNNSLSSNNAFLGSQVFDAHNNTMFQVIRYKSGGVWFKWETDVGGTHRVGCESNAGSMRYDFPEAIATIGINNTSTAPITNIHRLATTLTDATNSVVRMDGANSGTKNISAAGAYTDAGFSERLSLGNNLMFNLPAKIDMAEVICYNSKLVPADINKVESYLAIKYGFTLDQSTAQNYVSSAGTVTWDGTLNAAYNKDITGIGRDDASTLNQKQSRNNSLNDAVTLSLGAIAVDNAANGSAFTNDQSFLTSGHNGLTMAFATSTAVPQGFSQRLNRVWKAQQTAFSQPVTISFETSMLPAVPASSIRLLIDDDGDFTNATAFTGAVNGTRLEFTGQNFSSFTKMFYTLATCMAGPPVVSYNSPLCVGQTLVLQVDSPAFTDPTTTYAWSGPNAFSSSAQSPSITPVVTGTYSVTVSVNTCTLSPGTVTVTSALPNVTASVSQAITCASPVASLTGSSSGTGVTYVWSGPGGYSFVGANAATGSPGTYTLTVSAGSCSTSTTVVVVSNTVAPNIGAGPTQSLTCSGSVVLGGTSSTPGVSYAWTGPGGFTSSVASPTVASTGDYTLTVTDPANGCSSSTVQAVVPQSPLVAVFSADPSTGVAPLDVHFSNNSTGATTYQWTFGDGHSSSSADPSNTYQASGTYTVMLVASSGGCTDTAYAVIVVENDLVLEIPNVFTPNGDYVNDAFTIKAIAVKSMDVTIYNRWGEKMYSYSGDKPSWDGASGQGGKAPAGTYFYMLKATGFNDKTVEKQGTVTLFR